MLAATRVIKHGSVEIARTPLIVPSFSSKGFPHVMKIIQTLEEAVTGCILVSAYDIAYDHVQPKFTFPSFVFLDSGGYECGKDTELSELGYLEHAPKPWTEADYERVLNEWKIEIPTVAVSYDHPNSRLSIQDQIRRARDLFKGRGFAAELLIKPTSKDRLRIDVDDVIANIYEFRHFDVIGFTEKELGFSLFKRMQNIAKIRRAMTGAGLNQPIHIFGSLDTISSPLYFVAGADIFDGLTWLRFAYLNGQTVYSHNFAALTIGSRVNDDMIPPRVWFHNYQQLQEFELSMRRFIKETRFDCFRHHAELIERSYNELMSTLSEA